MSQSDARNRLGELSKERGASLASLSELLGRNPSYLQQFIKKGSPRKLEEGDRKTLAEFFGVDESELSKPQTSKKDAGDHDRLRQERIKIHERTFTAGLIGHQGKKRGRRMTRDT